MNNLQVYSLWANLTNWRFWDAHFEYPIVMLNFLTIHTGWSYYLNVKNKYSWTVNTAIQKVKCLLQWL